MSGKVRPIINNLKLQAGSEFYDVICNVADKKQLYSKGENNEDKMNDNNIKKYSEEIKNNIGMAYNDIPKTIYEKHKKINLFDINDDNITITKREISAPSSLYQQISKDPLFKLKMNLYKYKMKQLSIKRALIINEAKYNKNDLMNNYGIMYYSDGDKYVVHYT